MKGAYVTGYKKELYCSLCKQEKTMEQIEIRQSNEMTKNALVSATTQPELTAVTWKTYTNI